MIETHPPTTSPRAGYVAAGSVSAVIAAVLIIAGAFALYGESKKGDEHSVVEDFETSPFSARHRGHHGDRAPAPPAEQGFWAADVQGSGPQTLRWRPDAGDWSVVVMNADGSPGVAADVSAGAEIPFLEPLGWSLAGAGLVLLLAGGALIARGVRSRPRGRVVA